MNRRLPPGVDVQTLAAKRTRDKAESASSAPPTPGPASPPTSSAPRAPASRKLSPEELRERVHASLNVGNPLDNSASLVDTESQMTLAVMEIEPYDRNPRHTRNALFEDMKESIRATGGLRTPLTVTRRPGAKRYMIESGGNTRLLCLQTLFQETGERRFEHIVVTYRPWVSESHVLTSHFIENEVRGDMTFWDKAVGLLDLKGMLEQENKGALSARDFEAKLKERGLQCSRTLIGSCVFAVGQLGALGEAASALSRKNVRDLHPVFTALERLLKNAGKGDDWPALRDRTLRSAEQSWKIKQVAQSEAVGEEDNAGEKAALVEFDTARLIEQFDQSVATHLGDAPEFVRGCRELAQQQAASDDIAPCVMQMRIAQQPRRAPPRSSPSSSSGAGPGSGSGPEDERLAPTFSSSGVLRGSRTGNNRAPTPQPAGAEPVGETECLARVQALADAFAQATGVLDCLFVQDDWPTGFWVEIPSEPIDLDPAPANRGRYAGWWMLAMLSGQIGGAWSAAMPADSLWRQAQRQENGHDEVSLMGLIETVLANPIGLMELADRLGEPDAPEIDDYLRLVQSLRALRREAPHRFAVDRE